MENIQILNSPEKCINLFVESFNAYIIIYTNEIKRIITILRQEKNACKPL